MGLHRAEPCRSSIAGLEAFALASDRSFPRHSHDGFGIGVLDEGAHRSWSGIGYVDATAGDVITVNPGEMHDGNPVRGAARRWRMLYLDPDLVARALPDEATGAVEIARPVLRDPFIAARVGWLFASLSEPVVDLLRVEEDLVRMLSVLLIRHGSRKPAVASPAPSVAAALRRLTERPEQPVTLIELAALSKVSRFQLLRGFAKEVGVTPHAFLVQRRVSLARRLLAKGERPAAAAVLAGFADQSHLTRAFRRQLGVTPARYRAAVA